MKKILLVTTLMVGTATLAHAGGNALPNQGLNAGAMSGSSSSIGVPYNNLGTSSMPGGFHASVSTSGNAYSTSAMTLSGGTSNSNSTGSININGGGKVIGGTGDLMSASRTDQAYTALGGTISASVPNVGQVTYTNKTSALSGDSLTAQSTAGNGGWSNFQVNTTGNSYSDAHLGQTTTANAYSNGSLSGTADQQAGFTGQRIDNATSQVSVAGYVGGNNFSVGGNLGAEANAGHDLNLSVPTQPQLGNYYNGETAAQYTPSVTDANNASSTTTIGMGDHGLTSTSTAYSSDKLTGSMPALGTNGTANGTPGTFSGTSGVNAQTDMQLTGDLSGKIPGTNVSGSLSAGGYDGYNNVLNSPSSN